MPSDIDRPNGLAFSLDDTRLYVADTMHSHIRIFDVEAGQLRGRQVFAAVAFANVDGIRLDTPATFGSQQDQRSIASIPTAR